MKQRNPVAKNSRRFNRAAVHKDKRKQQKHSPDWWLEYLESLENSDSTYFNQEEQVMIENELTRALTEQSQRNFEARVREQNLYGSLINWRTKKVQNTRHRRRVLSGYSKIMSLVARGIK